MVPRVVLDALMGELPAEVVLEVIRAIDDYARYWEIHQTGEGFDIFNLSPMARVAFKMVYKTITEYNSRYIQKVFANTQNALSGWEKRRGADERNRRRREAYAAKKGLGEAVCMADGLGLTGDERMFPTAAGREETATEKGNASVDNMGVSSDFMDDEELSNGDETVTKALTKTFAQTLSSNGLSESMRSHRVIGLNNNLVKNSVVIEERGCGGKQVIHRPFVENFSDSYPSSGLTGNNPAAAAQGNIRRQGAGNKPDPPVADPEAERGGPREDGKGQKAAGTPAAGNRPSDDGNKRPPTRPSPDAGEGESSASDCVRGSGLWQGLPSYRWPPGDQVVVGEDFQLDFLDPELVSLNFIDDWLADGVAAKIRLWKMGRSIDKWWVRRLIFTFAKNQGRTESLSAELLRRAGEIRR